MNDHDPLCGLPDWAPIGDRECDCGLIARVRAEERERIAQEIEEFADDWSDWDAIVKTEGDVLAVQDVVKEAIHDVARVARPGGESDGGLLRDALARFSAYQSNIARGDTPTRDQ